MPILTWHNDKNDTELLKLIPLLEYMASIEDVRRTISKVVSKHKVDYNKVNDIIAVNQSHTPKKPIVKIDNRDLRSNSTSNYINYPNTYKNTLQEWTKYKEKISNNLEEQQQQQQHHRHLQESNINLTTTKSNNDKVLNNTDNNKHSFTLKRTNPTIVKTQYNTEQKPKYNRELQNTRFSSIDTNYSNSHNTNFNYHTHHHNNSQIYSNPALNLLQASPNYNTIDHSNKIYQPSSSLCPSRHINSNTNNDKELKRNSSCTCFKTNQDYDMGLIQPDSNFHIYTPPKANYLQRYQTNEEEEEKNIFDKASYNKNNSLYSSTSYFRRSFNPGLEAKPIDYPQENSNHNTNYYSIRRMMMNRRIEDNRMETPGNNRYRYNIDNDNSSSKIVNKNRLLFNSSTIGSDYRSEGYSLKKREYNNSVMSNTFY